ncbi:enolase C-terminal domain-like protein [Sandaracinobacteroides saxicola]|uniref:Dipeptide epimerase n=1 Tax=Sandaracinobacteroides saxicola TaxID=2759707 RepID=A0A7G5IDX6_9SPHN|nr:enolase C-terminal domain-like protein [Sandaracinobacteroides saxicola]QMW21568.1 dipeptide epimerase [Sandaracinobacteroides saxicola]
MNLDVDVTVSRFATRRPLAIARGVQTAVETCHVRLLGNGVRGAGEAVGVSYHGETADSIAAQVQTAAATTADIVAMIAALPPGGARAALDAAWWDWQAKADNRPVFAPAARSVDQIASTWTVSLGPPGAMAAEARACPAHASAIKVKLGGTVADDERRIAAIRAAMPDSVLLVDGNAGWTPDAYRAVLPGLCAADVACVEQPCPPGSEAALADLADIIPLCADEAVDDAASVEQLSPVYQSINIKLDKCGGPSEALRMVAVARARGLGIMAGSMLTTSLGVAPLFLLAAHARWFDIDAATYLVHDRAPTLVHKDWRFRFPSRALWG